MSLNLEKVYASLPKTVRGMPLVISGDPKGENMLYCNSQNVIIRNVQNPNDADLYADHAVEVIVAKYSPSRFYIASGDVSGKVRIWDTVNKTHIVKAEYQPLGGCIKDLAWSPDNTKIVVGGEGREKFGHAFNMETGTSVGDITGQSKALNACDFRSARPFRIVTASEDNSVGFFEGPPFKYKLSNKDHTRFANAVRYSPNGEVFISGGADGRAYIYDGKTGEKKGELGDPAHKGGIYALSFHKDSKKVVTASGDKTVKTWDVETGTMLQQFDMGTQINDMQLACLWQNDDIITVSLSGYINYLDPENPEKRPRIIKGHNKPITALAVLDQTIFTAASDGAICHWDVRTGENDMFSGKAHANQVQCMAVADGQIISCGMDDSVIYSDISTFSYGDPVKLPSMPYTLDAAGGLVIVACVDKIVVLRNKNKVFTLPITFTPSGVSIRKGQGEVAVGGNEDQRVHVFTIDGDTLNKKTELVQTGSVVCVKYSPDGRMLAASNDRRVFLYEGPENTNIISSEWCYNDSKVRTMDWSPDSRYLATSAVDSNIVIYDSETKSKLLKVSRAHKLSTNCVKWLNENTLVSVAQDSNMKTWTFKPTDEQQQMK